MKIYKLLNLSVLVGLGLAFSLNGNSAGYGEKNTTNGTATETSTGTTTGTTTGTDDTSTSTATPNVLDQSSGTTQDVEITRRIREELNDSEKLSTSAKNIEVITLNNVVTLRGTVPTQAEKEQISSVARNVAGTRSINNELVVDTKNR